MPQIFQVLHMKERFNQYNKKRLTQLQTKNLSLKLSIALVLFAGAYCMHQALVDEIQVKLMLFYYDTLEQRVSLFLVAWCPRQTLSSINYFLNNLHKLALQVSLINKTNLQYFFNFQQSYRCQTLFEFHRWQCSPARHQL